MVALAQGSQTVKTVVFHQRFVSRANVEPDSRVEAWRQSVMLQKYLTIVVLAICGQRNRVPRAFLEYIADDPMVAINSVAQLAPKEDLQTVQACSYDELNWWRMAH